MTRKQTKRSLTLGEIRTVLQSPHPELGYVVKSFAEADLIIRAMSEYIDSCNAASDENEIESQLAGRVKP